MGQSRESYRLTSPSPLVPSKYMRRIPSLLVVLPELGRNKDAHEYTEISGLVHRYRKVEV